MYVENQEVLLNDESWEVLNQNHQMPLVYTCLCCLDEKKISKIDIFSSKFFLINFYFIILFLIHR
jgi:hypothetical protein